MSWTTPEAISRQIERLWRSGDILRALVGRNTSFPLRLPVKMPSTVEMALEFSRVEAWIAQLRTTKGYRLEYRNVRSATLGRRNLPCALWLDHAEDAVVLLGREEDSAQFLELHRETLEAEPGLVPWLEREPHKALSYYTSWPQLLKVVGWNAARVPGQSVYIRQINIAGLDTKFFEQHTAILDEMLLFLRHGETDGQRTVGDFHERYGLLREPLRVRFRVLDPEMRFAGIEGTPDVELDAESFAALRLPIRRIFVTENKTPYLCFPLIPSAIVIFGAGYAANALGKAAWVNSLPLYYWGDIDTHGFAILAQFRSISPHAISFLMDEETLLSQEPSWSTELVPVKQDLPLLTVDESALFRKLRRGLWRPGVRLEQEKIPGSQVQHALEALLAAEARNPSTIVVQV